MKLTTFTTPGQAAMPGVLLGEGSRLAQLPEAYCATTGAATAPPELASLQSLIEAGEAALDKVRDLAEKVDATGEQRGVHELGSVRLHAPLPRPVRMRCFSVYEKHMRQSVDALVQARLGRVGAALNGIVGFVKIPGEFYEAPAYYKGNPLSVIGPEDEVPWPTFRETKLDYELELGLVIGRAGQDISESAAREHIFGYTVYNDFSARDRLLREMRGGALGPRKGKDFEGGNAMGPWIVTADEIPDPTSLRMEVRVNGQTHGVGNTADMYHSLESMLAEASAGERLCPGEFFGTGAVGDGTGIEHWRFLEPGDEVELEIEKIGVLRNRIGPRTPQRTD